MFVLTDEQHSVFDGVLASLRRGQLEHTIGGYAGTGKTVLVAALAERLPGFAVAAFTRAFPASRCRCSATSK
jgi:MoxR-like ATPase